MSNRRRIRMSDADFAALRERVRECAPEIAEAYWGPPVYVDRNEMRFGRNTGSLRLTLWPPDERGLWVDFGDDNRGGDMFTAMRERCGGDWDLTLEEACRRTGFRPTSCDVDLSDEQAQILAESARKRAEARAREQAQAKPKSQGTGAYALQLFEKSRPIAGTLAERYVRDIRLGGHDLPLPGELRYHPSVWSRETASEHQALIIGCHDDGKLVRVQAVLLDHRTGKKANVKSPKLTFGAGVAHVPASLSPWNTDEPQFHLLAEGPEDAIVLNACTGWRVDASLGAGSLHKPHYQAGTRLVIVGDNGETGHTQAERAATVHRAAGCDVIVIYPPEDAKDANDVLLQGGPDAVKAWIEEGLKAKPRQDTEELTPGSPADIYLTETCCIPRPADGWPSCVRRLLPQGAEPEAIALLATDAEGRVIGCQRVEIIDDGKKPLTVAGGIVRLPGPANGPLQIVRGMQPALSVWAATGFETWIALDSLAKLPLPTDRLVIACRDDDPQSSPADKALRLAVAAWQRSGHTVRIATPRDIRRYDKSDFNTVIKCDGIDTVRARIDAAIT
ncbi:MAG: toprim domain-containing protein, partial [Rhodopila sp.]